MVKNVLMVDDDPDIRRIGEISLERVGKWSVMLASSGKEALAIAIVAVPDVILLDVMMPETDGLQTLALLRSTPEVAHIPIIMMTAKIQKREVERYIAAGATGVISKPFDPISLPDDILRVLGALGEPS